jgi:replicative DNA helicase
MANNKTIKKYYDKRSVCQVLGVLMQEPNRIKMRDYYLEQKDFSIDPLHQIIFTCIYNLTHQGVKEITIGEIEGYLANTNPVEYSRVFEKYDGLEWMNKVLEDATPLNFDYHYNKVKKMSLLRSYLEQGINISHILDKDEIDPNLIKVQEEIFDKKTLEEIMKEVDERHLEAKRSFIIKDGNESRKAGDNAKELKEQMSESPSYGLGLESEYLNTIMRGALKGKFFLETRDTGQGKSRIAIKRLLNFTAPLLWSHDEQDFVVNPCGGHSGLYIGTEMDLYTEIEPMMWAFISGVEEDKIVHGNLNDEEDERVQKAIEILQDTKLFLEDEPNFDLTYLWHVVEEYKVKHDIYAVALDYIELTSSLMAEYSKDTKGMATREDQVLLNLSTGLKNIAKKLDVWVLGFTQTTDEARRDEVRDQRAVKGARSLPNKVDVGMVTFEPTKKELEKLEPVIAKQKGILKNKYPNVCYSIYKNRGGKVKKVKVWGYQNLGNMEYIDMFCTNDNYEQINIDKTKIQVVDDKITTS